MCLCALGATSAAAQTGPAGEGPALESALLRAFGTPCFNTGDISRNGRAPAVEVCPSLETQALYEDNAFRSADKQGDLMTTLSANVGLRTEVAETPVTLDAGITRGRSVRFDENDSLTWNATLALPVLARDNLRITTAFDFERARESRASPDSPGRGTDLNISDTFGSQVRAQAGVGAFQTLLGVALNRTRFVQAQPGTGDTRDLWTLSTDLRVARDLGGGSGALGPSPDLGVFVEAGFQKSFFDVGRLDSGRLQGNSQTTLQGGVTYAFSDITSLDVGLGVNREAFRDPNQESQTGVLARASLEWLATDLTLISADFDTQIDQTQADGASVRLVRSSGVEIAHALTYNMDLNFDAGVEVETFRGTDRRDIDWNIGAQWDLALTDGVALAVSYAHDARRSRGGTSFHANTVSLDLTTRF